MTRAVHRLYYCRFPHYHDYIGGEITRQIPCTNTLPSSAQNIFFFRSQQFTVGFGILTESPWVFFFCKLPTTKGIHGAKYVRIFNIRI